MQKDDRHWPCQWCSKHSHHSLAISRGNSLAQNTPGHDARGDIEAAAEQAAACVARCHITIACSGEHATAGGCGLLLDCAAATILSTGGAAGHLLALVALNPVGMVLGWAPAAYTRPSVSRGPCLLQDW